MSIFINIFKKYWKLLLNREATTYNDDYRGNSIFKQRLTVRNIANYLSSQDNELRYAYYVSCVLFLYI